MKKLLKTLNKIADKIDFAVLVVATILIMFVFAANVAQVVVRKLGGTISWADEASRYTLLILVGIAAAMAIRKGEATRITLILDRIPQRAAEILNAVEMLVVEVVMVITTYSMALSAKNAGTQTLGILTSVRLSTIYWILFVALILFDIYCLIYVLDLLFAPETLRKEETVDEEMLKAEGAILADLGKEEIITSNRKEKKK